MSIQPCLLRAQELSRTAADAGADGVIVPDLPYEERALCETEPPASTSSSSWRRPRHPRAFKTIARLSRGFVYVVSLTASPATA